MLKRIPVGDLRVGMHLHELAGAWLDHPFWRSSFRIDDAQILQKILASGICEAWIDTAKGLDVAGGVTEAEAVAAVELDLQSSAAEAAPAARSSTEEEVTRAREVCMRAVAEVGGLFREARMGKAIQPETLLPVATKIAASVERNPGVFSALLRLRQQDTYTYMHSVSVGALMIGLGRQLGLASDQLPELGLAGLLHDIGKVGVDLELLNKKDRLSEAEFDRLREHAAYGHRLLAKGNASEIALIVARHHHERADGSGYPDRLAGDRISLYARMAAVCDVYDATTSDRPYKDAWQPAHALRKMAEWSRSQYDTRVFHAFVRTVGIYPIGTLVRLKSGFLGVVLDQNEAALLAPRVKVFYATERGHRVPAKVVDLAREGDEILSHEDPNVWGITDLQALWSGLNRPLF
ncbi:MAG: HD-GYP domain-containing protein [Rhodocyclales bacterium]|nr:HD-GYP domain-containing protein [Rhodocyclales bacterium]